MQSWWEILLKFAIACLKFLNFLCTDFELSSPDNPLGCCHIMLFTRLATCLATIIGIPVPRHWGLPIWVRSVITAVKQLLVCTNWNFRNSTFALACLLRCSNLPKADLLLLSGRPVIGYCWWVDTALVLLMRILGSSSRHANTCRWVSIVHQINWLIWIHYASLVLRILIDVIKSKVMGPNVAPAIIQLTR